MPLSPSKSNISSDLRSGTVDFSHSDHLPTMTSSHNDSTHSGSSVRDDNDDDDDIDLDLDTDIEDGQAEIVSVTNHGSVSQMLRGVGAAWQRVTPSVIAKVDSTNETVSPLVDSSSHTDAPAQDDRMQREVLGADKVDEKHESPVTGESQLARNAQLSNGNTGFGRNGRPGIVRKTKPPPIDIGRTMRLDRLSIASIGDLVKRATSSFRGTAAESHAQPRAAERANGRAPVNTDKQASRGTAVGRQSRTPVSPDGYDQQPGVAPRNRNRVFGLRWWVFTLIAIIIITTIVVCIVVPIQVRSHQQSQPSAVPSHSTSPSQAAMPMVPVSPTAAGATLTPSASPSAISLTASECQSILPCENNGVSVVKDNACACICVGDFGGTVCGNVSNTACSIVTIPDSEPLSNVTVGTSIAPLLSNNTARLFPSVELYAGILFDVFNSSGVSCASQNALVTFNGVSRLQNLARSFAGEHSDYHQHLRRSSNSDAVASFNVTGTVLNFARVVVLDVAQTNKSVEDAVTIQQSLQEAFTEEQIDPSTGYFNTGTGIWVNFVNFTVGGIFTINA
ncbi:hypothetical protein V1509DRAFT_132562 [Lipomyces kononenkoae]